MALLTRDERQSLTGPERKSLRKERRKARGARHEGDGVWLDLKLLRRRARDLLMDYAGERMPGRDRMDEVLDQLVEEADEFLVWTWAGPVAGALLEVGDGPALRAIIRLFVRPHVQDLYDHLHDVGLLTPGD